MPPRHRGVGSTFSHHWHRPGLRFHSSQGGLLTAVGNTWVASEQGADAAGQYAVLTGTTRNITGPAAVGVNYGVSYAGAVLRLAEIAP